jgi:hypothetical protein
MAAANPNSGTKDSAMRRRVGHAAPRSTWPPTRRY